MVKTLITMKNQENVYCHYLFDNVLEDLANTSDKKTEFAI